MTTTHHRLARYEDFSIGQRATFSKTISEVDISNFVAVTGDVNPLHVDSEFARSTFFGSRIAAGVSHRVLPEGMHRHISLTGA